MGVVNEIIDLITGHRQNSSFVPTFGRQRRGGCFIGRPSTGCCICVCARSHICGLVIGLVEILWVGVFITSIFIFHCIFLFVFVLLELCRCIVVKIGAGGV